MTSTPPQARTLGELKRSGYRPLSIREEWRKNLIAALDSKTPLFPNMVGYEDSVVPQIENAILSGHDMIFLGERGQGKTRIIRSLIDLLDEFLPVVKGTEVADDPFAPISRAARQALAEKGDDLEIEWLHRSRRYGEKLATPDTTTAELIGDIDPIKVAEGRYLSDEMTIHFGLIPRSNRGIFAINELPDLAEKVQVSLFNILEERDVQIKGYTIRLPLDIVVVATANPEDYTSRGRIITPLKDRFDVQIRTHYPRTLEDEIAIVEQEVPSVERSSRPVRVPAFIKEIVAQMTFEARASNEINQASGVSVRVSINNYESLLSNAEKRAVRVGEREIVPRTNRGIFAINELPDLTEKVQVGLFNLMEEKDVQIKGYKIRLPLDVVIVASANPEDYTSRGRIITPLKDRFDVQIRTHYPTTLDDEIAIMEQEVPPRDRAGRDLRVPDFVKQLIAQLTMEARASNEINQASGVSVRVTINNYESVIANAEKRAVRCGEREIVPRITDLHAVLASTAGKIELEYAGEEKKEGDLIDRLLGRAVMKVFDRAITIESLKKVIDYFEGGGGVEVSDRMPAVDYLEGVRGIPGLREAIVALGPFESPALVAAATEFILEGLHVHQKLNKDRHGGRFTYRS